MYIIAIKNVITRKEHNCFGCARKMPKGTTMQLATSVDGGVISTERWCSVCQAYWSKHMEYGDEIGYGDLRFGDPEGWEQIRETIEQNNGFMGKKVSYGTA